MAYGITDRFTGGTASGDLGTTSNAFDDNDTTSASTTSYPDKYIKYDFGAGVTWAIGKLTIVSTTDDGILKDFIFSGSNNDSDWTVVYTGQKANSSGSETFTFANPTKYRYYRWTGITSWDVLNHVKIHEISGYEIIPDVGFFMFMT